MGEFLNKCPLVQELTLDGYNKKINGIVLKNLTYLMLKFCDSECIVSVLEQESKFSLKTVGIRTDYDVVMECEFPVISKLDKIILPNYDLETINAINKIVKMFPIETEVRFICSNKS
jgi:hypothetical protein